MGITVGNTANIYSEITVETGTPVNSVHFTSIFHTYSSPLQLRFPQLCYFHSYAILKLVPKKLKLSYFLLYSMPIVAADYTH